MTQACRVRVTETDRRPPRARDAALRNGFEGRVDLAGSAHCAADMKLQAKRRAASCRSHQLAASRRMVRVRSMSRSRFACGSHSRNTPSHFPPWRMQGIIPVMFPPGRLGLQRSRRQPGRSQMNTIGIAAVSPWPHSGGTAGRSQRSRPPAVERVPPPALASGRIAARPAVFDLDIAALVLAILRRPRRNAATRACALLSFGAYRSETPTAAAPLCARAASGHAAAPPKHREIPAASCPPPTQETASCASNVHRRSGFGRVLARHVRYGSKADIDRPESAMSALPPIADIRRQAAMSAKCQ